MRVLLTTAHGIASCGYTKTAFDDMARFNAYPELPEAAKALLSQSICLWALGRLSEAAVFIERSLLVSPEDIVLRRWCFVRAAFLTSLGCPDVARAVLDQEQRLDPLLRDLADELERTRAGGAPSTPANLLVGYDRLLFLGAASVVAVAQLHVDECVAYLRIAAAHTQTACASIQAGMALCNLADAAVQLALLCAARPQGRVRAVCRERDADGRVPRQALPLLPRAPVPRLAAPVRRLSGAARRQAGQRDRHLDRRHRRGEPRAAAAAEPRRAARSGTSCC
jgi:tetratricopeptide (TPR) repeat protein